MGNNPSTDLEAGLSIRANETIKSSTPPAIKSSTTPATTGAGAGAGGGNIIRTGMGTGAGAGARGTLGHPWGNGPGAVANRVALETSEGDAIIREACKWSPELSAICEVFRGAGLAGGGGGSILRTGMGTGAGAGARGTLGHPWGNAPGAVANRVALETSEGDAIIREACKWSPELAAICEVFRGAGLAGGGGGSIFRTGTGAASTRRRELEKELSDCVKHNALFWLICFAAIMIWWIMKMPCKHWPWFLGASIIFLMLSLVDAMLAQSFLPRPNETEAEADTRIFNLSNSCYVRVRAHFFLFHTCRILQLIKELQSYT